MLLFRGEEHVERAGQPQGSLFTPDQLWRLADIWYHDRADPAWHRKSAVEAEAVFAAIGLTGDFWRLTG